MARVLGYETFNLTVRMSFHFVLYDSHARNIHKVKPRKTLYKLRNENEPFPISRE